MNILITGGAGYIGSHMVYELVQAGFTPIVVDNLLTHHFAQQVHGSEFIQADIRDRNTIEQILKSYAIETIFHFASRIQVGESVLHPRLYYRDNLIATHELIETALDANVRRFIFSSTAAVYGDPLHVPIDEEHPTQPVNPYGETKLAIERMLTHYDHAYGLRYVALRYFNAAGANIAANLGEHHEPETHLIPLVIQAALGIRSHITIFGKDYPTPDGTCIRDYIHVCDLAQAHLAAFRYLMKGGESTVFNLGTGEGHSVQQVIHTVEQISGRQVPIQIGPRRAGDPPILVASAHKAERALHWKATYSSLEKIIRDAWEYHCNQTYSHV